MSDSVKIAIIGDYNFSYNTHLATNLALDHASDFLETEINYYWLKISEASIWKPQNFEGYDGIVFAPGPFNNVFFVQGVVKMISQLKIPTILTGESFEVLLQVLINGYQLNGANEKLVSENLVTGNMFERVEIQPNSKEMIRLYENHSKIELTASRYSIYPSVLTELTNLVIDVEAYNQFEDPEVISLKNHPFFLACGFCPQISSMREMPHPLIYTFVKACTAGKAELLRKLA